MLSIWKQQHNVAADADPLLLKLPNVNCFSSSCLARIGFLLPSHRTKSSLLLDAYPLSVQKMGFINFLIFCGSGLSSRWYTCIVEALYSKDIWMCKMYVSVLCAALLWQVKEKFIYSFRKLWCSKPSLLYLKRTKENI